MPNHDTVEATDRRGAANPDVQRAIYGPDFYRTWRGQYLDPIAATSTGGSLEVKIPELLPKGGRAQHVGDDVAFKIVKRGIAVGMD